MKYQKTLVTFILFASLSLAISNHFEPAVVEDFPVGLHLDYTYINSDLNCGFHYNISGWVESPYNSSEVVLDLHSSITGDCMYHENDYLIFMPSWSIYAPESGSAWMNPLFTDTTGWYIGMDLLDSPVTMFYSQTEIQVEGMSIVDLTFGSVQCWWVRAYDTYPSERTSDFFFDVEWGICVKYFYTSPGGADILHMLYSSNIEFTTVINNETTISTYTTNPTTTTSTETSATTSTPITSTNPTTTTQNQTNTTSGYAPPLNLPTIILWAGVIFEVVVICLIIRYRKIS